MLDGWNMVNIILHSLAVLTCQAISCRIIYFIKINIFHPYEHILKFESRAID